MLEEDPRQSHGENRGDYYKNIIDDLVEAEGSRAVITQLLPQFKGQVLADFRSFLRGMLLVFSSRMGARVCALR